ncbi:serine/threonine-protein kinase [Paenibacillus shirakamiensis]|uniref:Serine/threonine-protein kinase n=1 Tax=Paenibacillus shirakamiensis TaxID=1265935 RepID=A0ABS4JDZ4_9BACL|nr:serine/threonine-protein kinase [Paenibacillus shirakamiensis]MBP1999941.1 serine/threonine-protein kinase [Paenibacillus shirakamiensis]
MTKGQVELSIDNVKFHLLQYDDFQWIHKYGQVFCVFDQQESGNLSFGIRQGQKKLFLKFAGAKTVRYEGSVSDAIESLEQSVVLYQDLAHPSLIKLLDSFTCASGFGLLFEWVEGESLHPHWLFSKVNKYSHSQSSYYRFRQLPMLKKLQAIEQIFDFHVLVEDKGYVSVDFYDGSILYDFTRDILKICDIDFFRKRPLVNEIGDPFWGSHRFKSPEESLKGAILDERTLVFNMGAFAFCLLGGELDRGIEHWMGDESLYKVALRAVNPDRHTRYPSAKAFKMAWDKAVNELKVLHN